MGSRACLKGVTCSRALPLPQLQTLLERVHSAVLHVGNLESSAIKSNLERESGVRGLVQRLPLLTDLIARVCLQLRGCWTSPNIADQEEQAFHFHLETIECPADLVRTLVRCIKLFEMSAEVAAAVPAPAVPVAEAEHANEKEIATPAVRRKTDPTAAEEISRRAARENKNRSAANGCVSLVWVFRKCVHLVVLVPQVGVEVVERAAMFYCGLHRQERRQPGTSPGRGCDFKTNCLFFRVWP